MNNPYRRRAITAQRLDDLRRTGTTPRLPRRAILWAGMDLLDQECQLATHKEIKNQLKRQFT